MRRTTAAWLLATVAAVAVLPACGVVPDDRAGTSEGDGMSDGAPERITIRPDDYHVPYAGTAADGRRFFLSEELFHAQTSYVGLFLWKADGTFDSIRVTPVPKRTEVDTPSAPSTAHANGLCPCEGTQGWKWSDTMRALKPWSSAALQYSTSSVPENCSAIAA